MEQSVEWHLPSNLSELANLLKNAPGGYISANNEEILRSVLIHVKLTPQHLSQILTQESSGSDFTIEAAVLKALVSKDNSRKEHILYLREHLSSSKFEDKLPADQHKGNDDPIPTNMPVCISLARLLALHITQPLQRRQILELAVQIAGETAEINKPDKNTREVVACLVFSWPEVIADQLTPSNLATNLSTLCSAFTELHQLQEILRAIATSWRSNLSQTRGDSALSTVSAAYTRLVMLVGMLPQLESARAEHATQPSESGTDMQATLIQLLQLILTKLPQEVSQEVLEHLLFKLQLSEAQGSEELKTFVFRSLLVHWYTECPPSADTLLTKLLTDAAHQATSGRFGLSASSLSAVHSLLVLGKVGAGAGSLLEKFDRVRVQVEKMILGALQQDGLDQQKIGELQMHWVSLIIMQRKA